MKTDFYIYVIKWYNIPVMHFATLTLVVAHQEYTVQTWF